jgi:hypothetical protein
MTYRIKFTHIPEYYPNGPRYKIQRQCNIKWLNWFWITVARDLSEDDAIRYIHQINKTEKTYTIPTA